MTEIKREKALMRTTLIYFIGNLSSKIIGFLMMLVFTHYLSPSELGGFDLIFNAVSVIIPVATLCTAHSVFRFVLDLKDEHQIGRVLSNGVFIIGLGTMAALLIYLILSLLTESRYLFSTALLGASTALCGTWQQAARALKKNLVYSMSGVLLSIFIFVTAMIFLAFKMGVQALLLSFAISPLLVFVYLENRLRLFGRISLRHVSKETLKELTGYSLPLIPAEINWWLLSGANRFAVSLTLGLGATGLLSVADRFPSLMSMTNDLFNKAWCENAVLEYHSADRNTYYSKVFTLFFKLQFCVFFLLLPLMKTILLVFVGKEYYSAWVYVPCLMLGSIFLAFGNFYGTGYLLSKKTKGAFYSTLAAGIINLTIIAAFINRWGLYAVVVAHCAAHFCLWLYRVLDTRKFFRIHLEKKTVLIFMLFSAVYLAGYYWNQPFVDAVLLLTALVLTFVCNKQWIRNVFTGVLCR